MSNNTNSTKVITEKIRLSFAHLFEPYAINGGEPKYSVSILIPKTAKKTLAKLDAAVEAAKEEGKGKWGGKIPHNLKLPVRDGDLERPDDPAYVGHVFFTASSKSRPDIAKPNGKDANGKTKFLIITDPDEVYSGCYAKASLNAYPFNANGNRGIAIGLNSIVKVQDGEPLGGRSSINEDFSDEDFEDSYEDDEFLA
ncbi:DUF2815 family protein [Bacillus paranthracis]|uniref:DUF2815 family protein n=1 Tax=Bacillus paranthracis TaxID=2026186 RepID=UPI0020B8BE4D|nr:DUF2815 family protein [Bacillus paranthracis]